MPIVLERLGEDDWRGWRALRLAALAEAPDAFGSTLADWSGPNDLEERWRGRLRGAGVHLIAELDGTPSGMVAGAPADGAVELLSMWVAPAARGRGVGDALVSAIARWADGRAVALDVRAADAPAIGLYRRHGFIDAGAADDPLERRMVRPAGP